jgi:alpha-tubulin suppressor-like RCC1 family protein
VYTFGRGDHGRLGIASKANSYVPVMAHFQADSLVRVCGTHTHTHPRTHTCGHTHHCDWVCGCACWLRQACWFKPRL